MLSESGKMSAPIAATSPQEFWRVDHDRGTLTIAHIRVTNHPVRGLWKIEREEATGWALTGWAGTDWVEARLAQSNVFPDKSFARSYGIGQLNDWLLTLDRWREEALARRSELIEDLP